MSERQSTTPSSPERNEAKDSSLDKYNLSPEQRDSIESMQEFADDIAKKREGMMVIDQDNLLETPEHTTPSRKNSAHNLQILLARRHNEQLEEKVRSDEDVLEELLLDFQEDNTTGLSQEQKDEIIENIINRTITDKEQDTDDESDTNEDESREKSTPNLPRPREEPSMLDDMLDIPMDEARNHIEERNARLEAVEAEKRIKEEAEEQLKQAIEEANEIGDKKKRAEELLKIAKENGSVAAIKTLFEGGSRFFKYSGTDPDEVDKVLKDIAQNQSVTELERVEAAKMIDNRLVRNRVLGNVATSLEEASHRIEAIDSMKGAGKRTNIKKTFDTIKEKSDGALDGVDTYDQLIRDTDRARTAQLRDVLVEIGLSEKDSKKLLHEFKKGDSKHKDALLGGVAIKFKRPHLIDLIIDKDIKEKTRDKLQRTRF